MVVNCAVLTKLGQNSLGELLPKLYAPLVKAIDVPDDALNKYFVFIEGYKCTKGMGI